MHPAQNQAVVLTVLFTCIGCAVGQAEPAQHPQCRDPLFETHWAGKNDIQTLTMYPHVKTNLKMCPSFNQKASCCHQTFESEQEKYFEFWRMAFEEKFQRVSEHREAVIASLPQDPIPTADREQYEVAVDAFRGVLSPVAQRKCFSELLTYAAGMMCFACRPEWFHFAVVVGNELSMEQVVRVRMTRSVCLQVWATCRDFGAAAARLTAAIRDSAVARRAPRAAENLDMFTSQQRLCDWMHDQVALHPFKLPATEDRRIGLHAPLPEAASSAERGTDVNAGQLGGSAAVVRRLVEMKKELDVLAEGRHSGFDVAWRGLQGLPPDAIGFGTLCATPAVAVLASVMAPLLLLLWMM